MANNFDMFTKKGPSNTSENLPYAFSHIATGAPPSVYMSMMTGNTFDEAMQETNNIPMESDEMDMDFDLDLELDPELDDPDAIEKAIYQLRIAEEKEIEPEEVLETPYGPGLSGEEIDLLLDMYPALDAGVDLDMIDENFDEVDRMLGKSGESIEAAMDAAERRAEDEGDIGSSPALMRKLGDNLGNSLEAMLNPQNRGEELAAESFTHSPFDIPEAIKEIATNAGQVFNNPFVSGDNKKAEGPSNLLGTSVNTNPDLMVSGEEEAARGKDWSLILKIIEEPTKEGGLFTPAEVVEELRRVGLTGKKGADYVKGFLADRNDMESDLRNWLELFVKQEEREPSQTVDTEQTKATPREEEKRFMTDEEKEEEKRVRADKEKEELYSTDPDFPDEIERSKLSGENLRKVFYTTIYGYPESGRSDVRPRLSNIFGDTQTLFFLEYGAEAFGKNGWMEQLEGALDEKGISEALGPMESRYKHFLAEYLTDPASKRSGDFFRKNLALISDTLSQAAANLDMSTWDQEFKDREYWIEAMFGETGGDLAAYNRTNLIRMAASQGGSGYYSSLIHRSVDRVMQYYRNIGWSEVDIFAEMAQMTGNPVAGPDAFQPVVRAAKEAEMLPPNQGAYDPAWDEEIIADKTGRGDLGELGDDTGDDTGDGTDLPGGTEGPPRVTPDVKVAMDPMAEDWEFYADPDAIAEELEAIREQQATRLKGDDITEAEYNRISNILDNEHKRLQVDFPSEGGGRPMYGDYDVDPMERDYGDVYSTFSPEEAAANRMLMTPKTEPSYDVVRQGGYAGEGGKLSDEELARFTGQNNMRDIWQEQGYMGGVDRVSPTPYATPTGGMQATGYPRNLIGYDPTKGMIPTSRPDAPPEAMFFQGDTEVFPGYQEYVARREEEEERNNFAKFLENIDNTIDPGLAAAIKRDKDFYEWERENRAIPAPFTTPPFGSVTDRWGRHTINAPRYIN